MLVSKTVERQYELSGCAVMESKMHIGIEISLPGTGGYIIRYLHRPNELGLYELVTPHSINNAIESTIPHGPVAQLVKSPN